MNAEIYGVAADMPGGMDLRHSDVVVGERGLYKVEQEAHPALVSVSEATSSCAKCKFTRLGRAMMH